MRRGKTNHQTDLSTEGRLVEEKPSSMLGQRPDAEVAVVDETAAVVATLSGQYKPVGAASVPLIPVDAGPSPIPLPLPIVVTSETLALDVDGMYPQMAASGTLKFGLSRRVHWVARLLRDGPRNYTGTIFYREGDSSLFPFATVTIEMAEVHGGAEQRMTARFSTGSLSRSRTFRRSTKSFRKVSFEFDRVEGVTPSLSINTGAHPNHPADLPVENLSIKKVYERAGFHVTSTAPSVVPVTGPGGTGPDTVWSNTEMHDAMEVNWSRFANNEQWALWTFYAALHELGDSLGGIMFDSTGSNHRQGTAIFCDSFIARPPVGDPNPAAWRKRMQFWTACHEMGHAFNLAHSWDKSAGMSWIPLSDEPTVRSFMNYPFRVAGGQSAFFSDFRFRFSDNELLFMRHAPERFVQMGNADWFDNHAFENAEVPEEPTFRLELRQHRTSSELEFMEPLMVELKLTNASDQPQIVGKHALETLSNVIVIVKKEGKPARQYTPFARYCYKTERQALQPGQSMYHLLFAGADRVGWLADEPGRYTVQAMIHLNGEDVVSNRLSFRIAPPLGYDAERLAQEYYTPDVGRALAFDGSNVMTHAMDVLEEVATLKGMTESRAALHARVALGFINTGEQKVLSTRPGAAPQMIVTKPRTDEAKKQLDAALKKDPKAAAESLGNIDYNDYARRYAKWLARKVDKKSADSMIETAASTLKSRNVIESAVAQVRGALKETKETPKEK
jgi:hypothetical protein